MSNPTTPFSWQMPQSTDLVTDLPADFEVFGQAVATSMGDLLGGTTGQILSKTTGTDMDFTWINNDQGDITGVTAGTGISGGGTSGTVTVTNSMATAIDAKGDLIAGTGADAFSRLAVGANTYLLTADSAEATGLKWAAPAVSASGLTLINSGGTTFTTTGSFSINNCFSATYQNYKIIVNYTAVSADAYVYLKMRASATDASTNYNSQRIYAFLSTVGTDKNANGTTNGQFLGEIQTAVPNGSVSEAFVYDPFGAVMTKFWVTNPEYDNVQAKPFLATAGGIHTTQTSYDGCTLLTSTGTISGTIYVYGMAV